MQPSDSASAKRIWDPALSVVEHVPDRLVIAFEQPGIMPSAHWHAQFEINYLVRGQMHYSMHGHSVTLTAGDICLFWGGLPHQVVDTTADALFHAVHLPLMNFFRMHLPETVAAAVMHGETLVIRGDPIADAANFERWSSYLGSDVPAKRHLAIDELLLRLERTHFEPFTTIGPGTTPGAACETHSSGSVWRICEYILDNFKADITSSHISGAAHVHPKYAMSIFKKSTGMTLNEYISLLRLSYAQALLLSEETTVLDVAMKSGFRSLSTFNAAFRRASGCSPSNYRRVPRA